jgi:Holliday junction DNA helicase RuvA
VIGRISGVLVEKSAQKIVVDCLGLGYELETSLTTFLRLPELGQKVSLHTHLTIRDDAHLLYGFVNDSERGLFRSLLKVNGVGTKVALVILSGMDAPSFANCVLNEDVARLSLLPGLGKKTAERLIVEMRDRVSGFISDDPDNIRLGSISSRDCAADAISGLVALGYKVHDANKYVHAIDVGELSSENIIREVLKKLVKK